MKITKVKAVKPLDAGKYKVAAYCRVSTKHAEQENSLEMQRKAYSDMIGNNPGWTFVGIYADSQSGLSVKKRTGFLQMIDDAMRGRVDLVLCKSISRFSRNIVECQRYVDMLRSKNVSVYFEKEHLRTDSPTCSLIFSLMSAIAQDESRSISDNMKTANRHRAEQGVYYPQKNHILGYTVKDRKLVPNEDAWIIRFIFERYAAGASTVEISRELNAMGARRLHTDKPFEHQIILQILKNECYIGDKFLQKKAPKNFITKRPDDTQPYESKYIQNDHEAIITHDLWDRVQERLRIKRRNDTDGVFRQSNSHPLFGRVICGCCGSVYMRTSYRPSRSENESPLYEKVWTCRERYKGKNGNGCQNPRIKERDLEKIVSLWEEREGHYVVRPDGSLDMLENNTSELLCGSQFRKD